MTLSIITATYNSAATLRDTLVSVGEQDYPNIEHILVDGVSKDNTLEIARAFPHMSRISSEPDHGLYDAMNKGVRMAGGDVIAILNSDDFYVDSGVVSRAMALLERSGADILYADLQYVQALQTDRVIRLWKAGHYRHGHFLRGWMPPHPTLFVRRKVYEKFGGFNTQLRFAADYEWMLRMIHRHRVPVCYLPEVIVRMRAGGLSNASFQNRWRANQEDRLAWQLNGLQPRFYTTYLKPLSKLGQYFK